MRTSACRRCEARIVNVRDPETTLHVLLDPKPIPPGKPLDPGGIYFEHHPRRGWRAMTVVIQREHPIHLMHQCDSTSTNAKEEPRMTVTDPFNTPSAAGASGLAPLAGRHIVAWDITVRENQPDPFNSGKFRDEVDAAITILDGPNAGETWPKAPVFGTRVVRQLKAGAPHGFAQGRVGYTNVRGKDALELQAVSGPEIETVRRWVEANLKGGAAPAMAQPRPAAAQSYSSEPPF